MTLKNPKNCPLLKEVYEKQQERLQAIIHDFMQIEHLTDVSVADVMQLMTLIVLARNSMCEPGHY